jgi:myosin heavy subunit
VDGNATFTRPKQPDRAHTLTWTLRDADAVGYDAKGWMISMSSDLKQAREEVSEREQAVSEKESCLVENERCLREKESSLRQRESSFIEKESTFLERESSLCEKESSLREEESRISKKERAMREKESSLLEKESSLLEKESSLLEKESGLLSKERQSTANAAAQRTKEKELMAKEAELRKLSDRLDATEAAQQKKAEEWTHRERDLTRSPGTNKDIAMLKAQNDSLHLHIRTASLEREVEKVRQRSNSISNSEQLRNLEVEKARLRVLLHAQQQKARNSPSPNQTRDAASIFNSPSSLATRAVKDLQMSTLGRNDHRPTSSSGSISRRPPANPSLATPSPSLRHTNKDTPSTPTRASTGMFSSTSGTQRSYDSRFSGWPEDDVPATPTRSSKRATPSTLGLSTPLNNRDQTRLSKDSLLPPNSNNRRAVSSQMRSPGPGSSISQRPSVSSAGGKTTSKSTPARTQPPQMSTLRYGAPSGMLPLRDDGDAIIYACGHKVYKPPRKLNKNVVGYLYE